MNRFLIASSFIWLMALQTIALSAEYYECGSSSLRLLETAFAAVSKMPLNPHIKNRSRAQLKVVETALAANLPDMAQKCAEKISNWQRLAAYSRIASFWAAKNRPYKAKALLQQIESTLYMAKQYHNGNIPAIKTDDPLLESLIGWRMEKIKTAASELRVILGGEADIPDEKSIGEEGYAAVRMRQAVQNAGEHFESAFEVLALLAAHPNIEVLRTGLFGLSELYGINHEAPIRRMRLEKTLETYLPTLPLLWQYDALMAFAEALPKHTGPEKKLRWLRRIDGMLNNANLRPELLIPYKSQLAIAFHKAGDLLYTERALAALQVLYDANRNGIFDIDRPSLLCRLAEIQTALNEREQALALYLRAVEEGQINPNSRPRADALCEICRSLALGQIEASEILFHELEQMNRNLGRPW